MKSAPHHLQQEEIRSLKPGQVITRTPALSRQAQSLVGYNDPSSISHDLVYKNTYEKLYLDDDNIPVLERTDVWGEQQIDPHWVPIRPKLQSKGGSSRSSDTLRG